LAIPFPWSNKLDIKSLHSRKSIINIHNHNGNQIDNNNHSCLVSNHDNKLFFGNHISHHYNKLFFWLRISLDSALYSWWIQVFTLTLSSPKTRNALSRPVWRPSRPLAELWIRDGSWLWLMVNNLMVIVYNNS
jgi:hypothetical protein